MTFDQMAQRQLDDYDRRQPGLVFADDGFRLTEAEAYRVQLAVASLRQRRGESVAGYKIGCVSESVRKQLGLTHPVFGHVFASELHASGRALDHANDVGLAIEGEYAVRIAEDIPSASWLEQNLSRAISSVFPVIELHNYWFRSVGQTAQELIANNAIHAGVVLLEPDPALRNVENLNDISVSINGVIQGEAAGNSVISGLLSLVEHLAGEGIHLQRGQVAMTGSPLPLYRVRPGDTVEVTCSGLPTVAVTIQ